ncbi:MAG: hypothetical protein GF308_18300 [Candidatus Heimdallarchaeota archaeon]|nr:hypothetical protein [Candidatus Heimdallarchaeota archaeon]
MNKSTIKNIALRFNEQINNRNLEVLTQLMTKDHRFIDSSGDIVEGQEKMKEAWRKFFELYPDYQNIFSEIKVQENLVIMVGHSECSEKVLQGSAIWTAIIRDDLVAEWRVFEDTEEVRQALGL